MHQPNFISCFQYSSTTCTIVTSQTAAGTPKSQAILNDAWMHANVDKQRCALKPNVMTLTLASISTYKTVFIITFTRLHVHTPLFTPPHHPSHFFIPSQTHYLTIISLNLTSHTPIHPSAHTPNAHAQLISHFSHRSPTITRTHLHFHGSSRIQK